MEQKRGIRVKTKETSIVDNIVNFFKKQKPQNQQIINQDEIISKGTGDLSPRSTTPRKRIFEKTPQKAGKLNFNKHNQINHRSMDGAYELTFNDRKISGIGQRQNKSDLSPHKIINPLGDTQFNRLILQNSNNNFVAQSKYGKTYLQDSPSVAPSQIKVSKNQKNSQPNQLQRIAKMSRQIQNQTKLIDNLKKQNQHLKKQNQSFFHQIESLKKKLKSYELTNNQNGLNRGGVEVIQLEGPRSPFDNHNSSKDNMLTPHQQQIGTFFFQKDSPLTGIMKQSLPILPQLASEFNDSNKLPKVEEMSLMSMNIKNLNSPNSSFLSEEQSFEMPRKQQKPYVNNIERNRQVSHPDSFKQAEGLQKTYFEKTVKPGKGVQNPLKIKSPDSGHSKQIFEQSQTVGYLRGDQPQMKKTNPFQQIATDSNKFYFKDYENQPNKPNMTKGTPTRQWLAFQQEQSNNRNSLEYSNTNSGSVQIDQSSAIILNKKNKNPFQPNQNKTKIDQTKSYKFADFDINEDQSHVNYF